METELKLAEATSSEKDTRIEELEGLHLSLRTDLSKHQEVVAKVQERLGTVQHNLQYAEENLDEKTRQLVEALSSKEALVTAMKNHSRDNAEFDALESELVAKEQCIEAMRSNVKEAEAARTHMEVLEFGSRQELDIALEEVKRLKDEVSDSKTRALQAEAVKDKASSDTQFATKWVFGKGDMRS